MSLPPVRPPRVLTGLDGGWPEIGLAELDGLLASPMVSIVLAGLSIVWAWMGLAVKAGITAACLSIAVSAGPCTI